MKKASIRRDKTTIIVVAVIISIVLYLAGVYSGLYANKVLEQKTQQEIAKIKSESKKEFGDLKSETKEDLDLLRNYINLLELNLKTLQFEQSFVATLDHDQMCAFSSITLSELLKGLGFYWDKLPYRIEEYEKDNILSDEYIALKKQYTQASIRTWILARNKARSCEMSFSPVLYFYSNDCSECISQGEQLDKLKSLAFQDSNQILVFTVDLNADDTVVTYLKEYYDITSAPSIIINDKAYQGRLFSADELFKVFK